MNNKVYLQEAKEEADFLLNRMWDFIDKLEKLEIKYKQCLESKEKEKEKEKVRAHIDNVTRLLADYKIQYKNICREAGIEENSIVADYSKLDIVALAMDKTDETQKALVTGETKRNISSFFAGVPARNKKFTGREREVRSFIERILNQESFAICGLKGMGGIGKTEIAKEVCYIFQQTWKKNPDIPEYVEDLILKEPKPSFSDGILWVRFEPEKQSPESIIRNIITNISNDPKVLNDISDLNILAELLKDKDVLIVLDSVEQNLHAFDFVLKSFKNKFPLIITSRVSIPGIHSVDIDVFSDIESKNLFISCLENGAQLSKEQEGVISDICGLLGNYPLIIERIAALVDNENSNLISIKENFIKDRAALLEKNVGNTEIDAKHVDVKTCFMMSLASVSDLEKNLFLYTSIFIHPFTINALATVTDTDVDETKQVINQLLRRSLISQTKNTDSSSQTYYLHPLMREFSLNMLNDSGDLEEGGANANKLLSSLKDVKNDKSLLKEFIYNKSYQDVERSLKYFEGTYQYNNVIEISKILRNPLKAAGCWEEIKSLSFYAIRAAAATQNPYVESDWYQLIGDITISLGGGTKKSLECGKTFYIKRLNLLKELNLEAGLLFSHYTINFYDISERKFDVAVPGSLRGIRDSSIQYSEEALLCQSMFTRNLGRIYSASNPVKSRDFFVIDNDYKSRKLNMPFQIENYLLSYADMVDKLLQTNDFLFCIPHYKNILLAIDVINYHDLRGYILGNLLKCFAGLEYVDDYERYFAILKENNNFLGVAEEATNIFEGVLQFLKADYIASVEAISSTPALFESERGRNSYLLGRSYLFSNDLDEALLHLDLALSISKEEGDRALFSNVFIQLSLLDSARGNIHEAVKKYHTAVKMMQLLDIKETLESKKIESVIYDQFINTSGDKELYGQLVSSIKAIDFKVDVDFIESCPYKYIAKDKKAMVLVSSGQFFFGSGEVKKAEIIECIGQTENYFSNLTKEVMESSTVSPSVNINQATRLYLYPFYIDEDLVTNSEYRSFCIDTEYSFPVHWLEGEVPENAENQPVINISLVDAMAYARWADKEIPTAAEWEKACRGAEGSLYPWGNNWDLKIIKSNETNVREEYEKKFEVLNKPELTPGCVNLGDEHTWSIPHHPETDFDDCEFLDLLERSLSLSLAEKQRVIDAIPTLSQFQINELTKVFTEERIKFIELEKEHPEDLMKLRRKAFFELKHPLLINESMKALADAKVNTSTYGVKNLVGSIYQFTSTKNGKKSHVLKGGSWFSKDLEESCKGFSYEFIESDVRRADTGFRCVKPIFSREDLD